jgi:hypothetical protein
MAPSRQPQPQFNKDEKVLCFHMDMLYEAKVTDVQPGTKPSDGHRYKVHYKGWKNTWDDWVLADRIRPFDDEHKELAAQLHTQLRNSMQKNTKPPKKTLRSGGESARGSEERSSVAAPGGRGGRRGKDWELEHVSCDAIFVVFLLTVMCSVCCFSTLLVPLQCGGGGAWFCPGQACLKFLDWRGSSSHCVLRYLYSSHMSPCLSGIFLRAC